MPFFFQCGTVGEQGVILPPPLNASSEKLERHGLFLMEDSQNIFLWVGREAVPQLVADVFDLPNYQALRGGKVRAQSPLSYIYLQSDVCFFVGWGGRRRSRY